MKTIYFENNCDLIVCVLFYNIFENVLDHVDSILIKN